MFAMPQADAERIAKSTSALLEFYKVPISPVAAMWFAFGSSLAGFYGPRVFALVEHRKRAATPVNLHRPPAPGNSANVLDFPLHGLTH